MKYLTPVLACKDRTLRILRDSALLYSAQLPGPPTCLHPFYNDGGENGDEVLYGTSDGKIGLIRLTRKEPQTHWLVDPANMPTGGGFGITGGSKTNLTPSTGIVQALDNYDITGDGVKDLIVGKHDGNIEVYTYEDGEDTEPSLKYVYVSLHSIIDFIFGYQN